MARSHQLTSLVEGISCFAWNGDHSQVAVCPNNNEIHIYKATLPGGNGEWQRLHVLSEHDLLVSSIDWSAKTNKIVSCSHDRNAFVWTFDSSTNAWKPTLVILRIDRAATDVKWSLDGLRFAVASSAKVVPVCMYEPANDWWVSKMVKKHKSTVLCCAFHPLNGQLLATGSSDFKCRVFSTFDADVDGTVVDPGPFSQPLEFGEVYAELPCAGWVNAVAWSPSGKTLAFAGHDCTLHVATFGGNAPVVRVLQLRSLPLSCLVFLTDKAVAGAGYDFEPVVFTESGATDPATGSRSWSQFCSLDTKAPSTSSALNKGTDVPSAAAAGGVAAARAMFQAKTSRGQELSGGDVGAGGGGSAGGVDDVSRLAGVSTLHCRAITGIARGTPSGSAAGATLQVFTSSMDGKIVEWDVPLVNINAATLTL